MAAHHVRLVREHVATLEFRRRFHQSSSMFARSVNEAAAAAVEESRACQDIRDAWNYINTGGGPERPWMLPDNDGDTPRKREHNG